MYINNADVKKQMTDNIHVTEKDKFTSIDKQKNTYN